DSRRAEPGELGEDGARERDRRAVWPGIGVCRRGRPAISRFVQSAEMLFDVTVSARAAQIRFAEIHRDVTHHITLDSGYVPAAGLPKRPGWEAALLAGRGSASAATSPDDAVTLGPAKSTSRWPARASAASTHSSSAFVRKMATSMVKAAPGSW